jgi:hypothetical protein
MSVSELQFLRADRADIDAYRTCTKPLYIQTRNQQKRDNIQITFL